MGGRGKNKQKRRKKKSRLWSKPQPLALWQAYTGFDPALRGADQLFIDDGVSEDVEEHPKENKWFFSRLFKRKAD